MSPRLFKGAAILSSASDLLPAGPRRRLLHDVLSFLIYEQFITSDVLQNPDGSRRYWRVTRGTGMGLRHSGPIADAVFLLLTERGWALRADIQEAHGILRYFRFRDDLWILSKSRLGLRSFYAGIRTRAASCFTLECVAWNKQTIDMMGITVYRRGAYLQTVPRVVAPQVPPLSWSSAHPINTLMSWPAATLRAKLRNCSCVDDKLAVHAAYIAYLQSHNAPPALVARLQSTEWWAATRRNKDDNAANEHVLHSWLVLGYHPIWGSAGLSGALHRFGRDPYWLATLQAAWPRLTAVDVRVAWSNQLPQIQYLLRKPGVQNR